RRDRRHLRRSQHGRRADEHRAERRRQYVLRRLQHVAHLAIAAGGQSQRRAARARLELLLVAEEALRHGWRVWWTNPARQTLVLRRKPVWREPAVSAGELLQ